MLTTHIYRRSKIYCLLVGCRQVYSCYMDLWLSILMYIPSMHPEVYYQYLDNMSLSKNFNSLHVVEMVLQTKGSDKALICHLTSWSTPLFHRCLSRFSHNVAEISFISKVILQKDSVKIFEEMGNNPPPKSNYIPLKKRSKMPLHDSTPLHSNIPLHDSTQ